MDKKSSAKTQKERLRKHMVNVHPDALSGIRSGGLDVDDLTLTGLKEIHDRIPHHQQDSFLPGGGIGNVSN